MNVCSKSHSSVRTMAIPVWSVEMAISLKQAVPDSSFPLGYAGMVSRPTCPILNYNNQKFSY